MNQQSDWADRIVKAAVSGKAVSKTHVRAFQSCQQIPHEITFSNLTRITEGQINSTYKLPKSVVLKTEHYGFMTMDICVERKNSSLLSEIEFQARRAGLHVERKEDKSEDNSNRVDTHLIITNHKDKTCDDYYKRMKKLLDFLSTDAAIEILPSYQLMKFADPSIGMRIIGSVTIQL